MKTILIVDNNRTIVEMLSDSLSKAGYKTVKAYDGMEALDKMKGLLPDMIVLDLIMPKIDGYRLAKYLKSDPSYRHIPIIILTGIAAEDSQQMYQVDADAFIAKGKMEETTQNLLATLKWMEVSKIPKREIQGSNGLYPREMTRELLLVKQHFDSMLQVMAEGVVEIDEHHRIFFANEAACQLLGKGEIELFSKDILEIFPETPELSDYLQNLPKRQAPGKPGITLRAGDKSIRLVATPFFFSQSYIGAIAVLEDITAQVKKELALEELTYGIIQNAPIGIALLDNDLRIVLTNDHFKKLAHAKGDIDRHLLPELPVFQGKPFDDLMKRASSAKAGTLVREEITFSLRGSQKMKTYHCLATPLHRQNGRPYLLLLLEDTTDMAELQRELVAANRELEAANQAKSNFLSIVSHELRTPLSVIRGYVSLILDGKIPGATGEALDVLKTSDKRARHLQHLIEELLDVSRIEAGKITLKEDLISLGKHIKETVEMFHSEIERKKLNVVTNLPSDLPEVVADHDKIHQIFTNLLSNAIKFTPDGGQVTISGGAAEGGVKVSVKDSGIGIPEDKLPLIFNKFYQIDSSDTRLYGGTGLGLSIVRMILEAMGGKISVSSQTGHGSTFTVFLPRGSTEKLKKAVEKPAEKAEIPAAERRPGKTILLCEDDEDTIKIIGYTLAEYELVVCRDGFEALEKVYTTPVDLILVDIRLPHMNGYDFCRILGANETTARIPAIILSAAGQEEEIRKGYEAGAKEYIIKPFSIKDLQEKVRNHLR